MDTTTPMENKLTTDVVIDVGEVGKGPLAGKVFPVEYLTAAKAEAKTAPTIRLGRNVYAINKPLDDCRAKGVYVAHVCTGTTHVFWLWVDAQLKILSPSAD